MVYLDPEVDIWEAVWALSTYHIATLGIDPKPLSPKP